MAARLARRNLAAGFSTGPASRELQSQIAALVAGAGLLAAERVRFSDEVPQGFDRELSSVVTRHGEVVAALLIRKERLRAIVETRVTTKEFTGKHNLPNALLLERSLACAQAAGLDEVILTANPTRAAETVRMARRLGGTLLRTHRFWVLPTG